MKKLCFNSGFILIIAFWGINSLFSQNKCGLPRKYEIKNSGCKVYFRSSPDSIELSFLDDGSKVFTTSSVCNNVTYGLLLVQFKNTLLNDNPKLESKLIQFTDVVKNMGSVHKSVGYGKGHKHIKNPDAIGIIDFCEDDSGNTWNFKSWIDTEFAAVLYIIIPKNSKENLVTYEEQQLFFNGFRFPGDK